MEILKYETDIDITHKLNSYELKAWIKHLKHILIEIDSLEKMWSFNIDDEKEDNLFIQKLEEKRTEADEILNKLNVYVVKKPNDIVCEDFQCDVDLISEHEMHRKSYLTFLAHYRKLKNNVFRLLQGKPETDNYRKLRYG